MISKKLLLFVITCTIIGNPGVIDVYAYGLDLVTLDIFGDVGNFLKKTGQGVTCFTSEIGRIIILDEYGKYFEHRLCENFS